MSAARSNRGNPTGFSAIVVAVAGMLGANGCEQVPPPAAFSIMAATFADTVKLEWAAQANVDSFRVELAGERTLTKWVAGDAEMAVFTAETGVEDGAGYTATVYAVNSGGGTQSDESPTVTANGFPWDEWFPTSLHATGQGLQTFYSAAYGGLEQFAGVPYSELACKNCHEPSLTGGCASCHDTATPGPGAQVDDGVAEGQACAGCHGRQASEVDAGFSDVHRDAGMACMDCHTMEDVMGDGRAYSSLLERGAIHTECEDCHTPVPANRYHDWHAVALDCSTCHTQGMITCYNCHYQSALPEGESELLAEVRDWVFLVNRDGKVHPASMHSLVYEGNKLLIIAPGYGHTIARNAISGCADCHGNAHILDLAEDSLLVVAEFDGEGSVNTAEGFIPVPFNYETALVFDFLVYDTDTETWSLLARGQDMTQFMFAEPLSGEQLEKLKQSMTHLVGGT
ncbi:MAG: hypothetical protein JSW46_06600 [Gemmatimonadota bacterium]|nr:MAG: hypothetical protein JSW46_06600 [Gemmatimonadota bacterium]